MSKVEIVGPRTLLEDVLSLLREAAIFQIEPVVHGYIEEEYQKDIRSYMHDEETLSEVLFLEDLRTKIEEMLLYLPDVAVRMSYIEPMPIIDTIGKTIGKHLDAAKEMHKKREGLRKEVSELKRHAVFLTTLSALIENAKETPDLDFIGLTIREPAVVGRLSEVLSRLTDWKFELTTEAADDGTLIGLITIEKALSEKVKRTLSDERIPELSFPAAIAGLSFTEKVAWIKERVSRATAEVRGIEGEMERFSKRWLPIYKRVREWIDERLSLLKITASVFETRMCFFINGWMPTEDMERLRKRLGASFGGRVALDEKGMLEEDLERVPIVLKNPPYFKPFELLVSLLPLPKYTSLDPTPFIAIFFPIFFGMILGDAGYGIILVLSAVIAMRRWKKLREVRDGCKILLISSVYSVLFGILYGEFFGNLGHTLFGLKPVILERQSAVLPMLLFALSVGVVHMLFGLFLGFLSAWRRNTRKEALFKFLSIVIILCIVVLVGSFFDAFPQLLKKPVVMVILTLTPLLLFTGGLLAPLELIKGVGNIISYARIMAIGLTSVLLAFVANELGGMTGNIVIGIVVAGLLHIINIILGVFSPTIHSLRLHYVEFFSKFVEHGGRKFEPLAK